MFSLLLEEKGILTKDELYEHIEEQLRDEHDE